MEHDSDVEVWEKLTVTLEKTKENQGFGIAISGGRDNPHTKTRDTSIVISDIVHGSIADGVLRLNDVVLSVNQTGLVNVDHRTAVLALKEAGRCAVMTIRRKKEVRNNEDVASEHSASSGRVGRPKDRYYDDNDAPNRARSASRGRDDYGTDPYRSRSKSRENLDYSNFDIPGELVDVYVPRGREGFGFVIGNQLYIREITPESPAANSGLLEAGDIISKINNIPVENIRSLNEAADLVSKSGQELQLQVKKPVGFKARPALAPVSKPLAVTTDLRYTTSTTQPQINPSAPRYSEPKPSLYEPRVVQPQADANTTIYAEPVVKAKVPFPAEPQAVTLPRYGERLPAVQLDTTTRVPDRTTPTTVLFPPKTEATVRIEQASLPRQPSGIIKTVETYTVQAPPETEPAPPSVPAVSEQAYTGAARKPNVAETKEAPKPRTTYNSVMDHRERGTDSKGMIANYGLANADSEVMAIIENINRRHAMQNRGKGLAMEGRLISFRKEGNLGIQVTGGNAVGIFIAAIKEGSAAARRGLKVGDQILSINGIEFRDITREEAVLILLALGEEIDMQVYFKKETFDKVRNQLGDDFYIKVNFDYSERNNNTELTFRKGEIFRVRDTMYKGMIGSWQAQRIGKDQHPQEHGILPNRTRAEQLALTVRKEEKKMRESKKKRRSSLGGTLKRRSEFMSSDKLDTISFSDFSLGMPAYEKVTLRQADFKRPVIIIGPLADLTRIKLKEDLVDFFDVPVPVDSYKFNTLNGSEVTTKEMEDENIKLPEIRDVMDQGKHCLLDITPEGIEMLHYAQLAPIVILQKISSKKLAKDIRASFLKEHFVDGRDTMSPKLFRRVYRNSEKIEGRHADLISAKIVINSARSSDWFQKMIDSISTIQQEKTWTPEDEPEDGLMQDLVLNKPNYASGAYSVTDDSEAEDDSLASFSIQQSPVGVSEEEPKFTYQTKAPVPKMEIKPSAGIIETSLTNPKVITTARAEPNPDDLYAKVQSLGHSEDSGFHDKSSIASVQAAPLFRAPVFEPAMIGGVRDDPYAQNQQDRSSTAPRVEPKPVQLTNVVRVLPSEGDNKVQLRKSFIESPSLDDSLPSPPEFVQRAEAVRQATIDRMDSRPTPNYNQSLQAQASIDVKTPAYVPKYAAPSVNQQNFGSRSDLGPQFPQAKLNITADDQPAAGRPPQPASYTPSYSFGDPSARGNRFSAYSRPGGDASPQPAQPPLVVAREPSRPQFSGNIAVSAPAPQPFDKPKPMDFSLGGRFPPAEPKPNPVRSSSGLVEPVVLSTARKLFDHRGGLLESPETGVSVFIPPGAITDGKQEVFFKVCQNVGDPRAPIVLCGPRGLTFNKAVELRLPHEPGFNPDRAVMNLKSADTLTARPSECKDLSLSGPDGGSVTVDGDTLSVLLKHF